MPDLFEAAVTVTALDAFQRYIGGQPKRKGKHIMCRCPWHNDRTPSLAFFEDGMFKCFGCGVTGTSIEVAKLAFNLDRKAAALRICYDFGVKYDGSTKPTEKQIAARSRETRKEELNQFYIEACDYLHALEKHLDAKAADERDAEGFSEPFIKAVMEYATIKRIVDTLLDCFAKDDIDAGVELMAAYKGQRKKWKLLVAYYSVKEDSHE